MRRSDGGTITIARADSSGLLTSPSWRNAEQLHRSSELLWQPVGRLFDLTAPADQPLEPITSDEHSSRRVGLLRHVAPRDTGKVIDPCVGPTQGMP
jgi:hypothetical protein